MIRFYTIWTLQYNNYVISHDIFIAYRTVHIFMISEINIILFILRWWKYLSGM